VVTDGKKDCFLPGGVSPAVIPSVPEQWFIRLREEEAVYRVVVSCW
jgi:hypothetical protein